MSAHQMICHLNDSFLMMIGGKDVSDASGVLQRTMIKWFALYAPLAWPPGLLTSPEIDQEQMGTCPTDFASDAAALEALLLAAVSDPSRFDGRVHPIFGRMSRTAWLRWAYLHTDHHLRQFGA
jgi:hypothetical protein